MTTDAPPSQGLIAGKYQLVRMIGRGGMGSVWEARHVSLGTSSAIKFIESDYADSQEARSRFDKEAKAAATIQSKHAIQIFDHGVTEDGKPYIVMELLQGEPLDKRIERASRLSLQETARILQQVCRGLARAHERGIIHRDLKPENIFLVRTPDDDEDVAKVLDFGIAKISGSPGSSGMTSSTKTGAVLGTPFYMSPEQARGLRNVDHRTDCWSLGVIAFKCLSGRLPFDGESVGDLLVKICTAPIPVPSQLVPGIPPTFDAWFMRALERDPERRFPNVTELSDALCFVAGIATRSQQGGAPSSHAASFNSGATTPQGLVAPGNSGMTPPHYRPPMQSGYGTPQPQGMPTPAPGAMTNAPFTSEQVPGVPRKGGGLVIGLVAGLMAIVGAAGAFVFISKNRTAPKVDTVNVVAPPPVVSASVDADAGTFGFAIVGGSSAPSAEAAAPKVGDPGPKPAPAPPTPKTTPKTGPAPKPSVAPPAPVPSTAPAPAPAPTPKKANKNDPGY